ncbi:MAG: hypothetical protein K2M06_03935 [Muribaculaceae bacterium]|nr:hypothetical protein [Muribaculaceae bacterium]
MYKTEIMRRNEAYVEAFRRMLEASGGAGSHEELKALAARALEQRPPHYYVTHERAQEILKLYRRGVAPRPGVWRELCDDVDRELAVRPHLGDARALDFVLCFKRPSRYHMSLSTAWRIILRHMEMCVAFKSKLKKEAL